MLSEQQQIWSEVFPSASPEQLLDHWEGCLRCVHDVRGQPSRREQERAARALSACQTKFCMSDLPAPIRCVSRVEEPHE